MNVSNECQSTLRSDGQTDGAKTSDELNWLLYCGVKNLLRCDEAEVVREIARYVTARYPVLRVGAEFVERRRNSFIAPLACFSAQLRVFWRFARNRPPTERRFGSRA